MQNGKALFSVTGVGTTSPDCSLPMTLRYSNVVVTVSGDSFDPDLVFRFPGTFSLAGRRRPCHPLSPSPKP